MASRRLAWAIASGLAPALVEERAVALFGRPQPIPGGVPAVDGHAATRLHVLSGGEHLAAWRWGRGPTVLLVHGWNGAAAQMSGFVAPLVEAGFQVVAFDQPAHGSSTGERATVVTFADAVRAVARASDPEGAPRVYGVVAHSLGATASALAIARGVEAQRAVLLAPPAEVPHFARAFARSLGLTEARARGMMERLRAEVGSDLDALDLRLLAPRMRSALLVMHDPQDREVPFEHGRAVAEAWPGGRFVPLEKLGHRRLLRDPKVIARAASFLRERAASERAA